jgi:hypothetical protein
MLVMCSEPADLLLCDFRLFVAWHVIVTTIAIMSAVIASEAIQEIVKEKSDKEKEANL